MGDKDFVKPILERKGSVHFGKVGYLPEAEELLLCFLVIAGKQLLRIQILPLPGSVTTFYDAVGQDETREASHICHSRY